MTDAEHSHLVFPEDAGKRFDRVLAGLPEIASRQMALRLIHEGAATISGQAAAPSRKLRTGEVVAYRIPPPQPADAIPEAAPDGKPLEILYEDDALIVVNKPAGLSMHPGPGHPGGTLVNHLLARYPDLSGIGGTARPGIVHRLDMDTSGVLVVAKHDAAHVALAAQFKAHSIHRVYQALVVGSPKMDRGTVDAPLARHPQHRVKRAVVTRGKRAVTHWQVLRRFGKAGLGGGNAALLTLLRVTLETGRTHQIRVHLTHAGWPVLGDPLYGNPHRVKGLDLPPETKAALLAFPRQALHAAELGIDHPTTGQRMVWKTELPKDLKELLSTL